MKSNPNGLLRMVLLLALTPAASATTWYVNGVSGSNSNNCMSATTACKSIRHAISLSASGDSILVAPATYTENLTIAHSLKVIGSGAATTIIDGGGVNTVVTISHANAHVTLSRVTIRNGHAPNGGGIYNNGMLTVSNSTINGNNALSGAAVGGGILNLGTLTINNSTVSGNKTTSRISAGRGGGIANIAGTLTINNSTITGNLVSGGFGAGFGGGLSSSAATCSHCSTYCSRRMSSR
jgi:autotransporter family porin